MLQMQIPAFPKTNAQSLAQGLYRNTFNGTRHDGE